MTEPTFKNFQSNGFSGETLKLCLDFLCKNQGSLNLQNNPMYSIHIFQPKKPMHWIKLPKLFLQLKLDSSTL